MPVTLVMMVHREFHIDDGVMFDSLRLIPVSRVQMKRRTKIGMGVAFLEPGRQGGVGELSDGSIRRVRPLPRPNRSLSPGWRESAMQNVLFSPEFSVREV